MVFQDVFADFSGFFIELASPENLMQIRSIALTLLLVLVSFKILQLVLGRLLKGRITEQRAFLVRKMIRYTGFVVAVMTVFSRLGIDLTALLGAAGIVGIAVGFAAQTSISNLISGFFLISEKPFIVGDVIQVDAISGIVQSVDSLSVKIQTFDNRFIRIPNETIIKSNVITITRFPIRRLDIWVRVSYQSDLEQVKDVLLDLVATNIYALDNPEPIVIIDKFDESGINIMLGVWFEKSNYIDLKNSMMTDIHKRFAAEGIEIPYPKMDVYMKNQMPL